MAYSYSIQRRRMSHFQVVLQVHLFIMPIQMLHLPAMEILVLGTKPQPIHFKLEVLKPSKLVE